MIGTPYATSDQEIDAEAAYVFEFKSGSWQYKQKLTPSSEGLHKFGSAVAMAGKLIVVGAPSTEIEGLITGAVHVYRYDEGLDQFFQEATLWMPSPLAEFGHSVSVNTDGVVVVSAPGDGNVLGTVHVYKNTGPSEWTLVDTLQPNVTLGMWYGYDVALDDSNTLVVGAPFNEDGSVFVYKEMVTNEWSLIDVINTNNVSEPFFGFSVDIDFHAEMSTIVVGSPIYGFDAAGAAYVYSVGNSSIIFQQKLVATDPLDNSMFGLSVAISDGKIAVGMPGLYHGFQGVQLYYHDGSDRWTLSDTIETKSNHTESYVGAVDLSGKYLFAGVTLGVTGRVFAYEIEENCGETSATTSQH